MTSNTCDPMKLYDGVITVHSPRNIRIE